MTRDFVKIQPAAQQIETRKPNIKIIESAIVVASIIILVFLYSFSAQLKPAEQPKKSKAKPSVSSELAKEHAINSMNISEQLEQYSIEVAVQEPKKAGIFTMRCASFRSLEAAENLRTKINRIELTKYKSKYIDFKTVKSKIRISNDWYQVVLPVISTKRTAEALNNILKTENIRKCNIVKSKR